MMPTDPASEYLANRLEWLMSLSLATPADVERWYKESETLLKTLADRFPAFEPEHEFWHFLSDADIRSKEKGYLDRQHSLMADYVKRLRHSN